jgi:cytochrome bd ubiquinol oxidase subunit II
MEIDLTLVSAAVIVFGVVMYVILDGFDLGVGILFAVQPDTEARDTMVNSIAPVWDGNETWLVLGGTILFGAFPAAYAIALPAFYVPIIALLFALIFRGVAFEFRHRANTSKKLWSAAFAAGSILAALAQGCLIGGLVGGVAVTGRQFSGGPFDWVSPLSAITALAVVAGYALLGATWLVLKTAGPLQDWARRRARELTVAVVIFMAIVSVVTPIEDARIAERWFGGLHLLYLSPVPVVTAAVSFLLWRGLGRGWERAPFSLAVILFLLGFLGLGISLWPNIVPPSLSIWDAAAPRSSQIFVLIGVAIALPMVLIYTWYAYHVFRGKVTASGGYAGEAGHGG